MSGLFNAMAKRERDGGRIGGMRRRRGSGRFTRPTNHRHGIVATLFLLCCIPSRRTIDLARWYGKLRRTFS